MRSILLSRVALALTLIAFAGCHKNEEPGPPLQPSASQPDAQPQQLLGETPHTQKEAPEFFVPQQDQLHATLIVASRTTDEGVANLLWLLRDAFHSGSLNALGLSQTLVTARDRMYTFHIYRGRKCVNHAYRGSLPPCAFSDQESGLYQVGSYGNREGDAAILYHGGIESKAEALVPFGSEYTPKPYIVAHAGAMPAAKIERVGSWGTERERQLANEFSKQVWGGGQTAKFATTPRQGELKMSADWLVDANARKSVKFSFTPHRDEACSAGIRTVRLSSGLVANPDSKFPLNCPDAH